MKIFYTLICAIGVLSFTSAEELKNDLIDDNCNLTFTINGGPGCIYNGTYPGWCSQEEFNEFADNVYSTSGCTRHGKEITGP